MKCPTLNHNRLNLPEVGSTQSIAAQLLKGAEAPGLIVAESQTSGRGRFGRTWHSKPGESLCMSLLFHEYADHPKPWLIGMSVAIAAAGAIKSQLQWPNDLTINKRKVGGILTEMLANESGQRIPVVGIGINLAQEQFPDDINERATSLLIERGMAPDSELIIRSICDRLKSLPEPASWLDLVAAWELFDDTPGKRYRLPDGQIAISLGIGPEGELIGSVEGETVSVMAAEAFF